MTRVSAWIPTVPPFEPCAQCRSGWIERTSAGGGFVAVRCQCWRLHQHKIADAVRQQAAHRTAKQARG
jgi:hypothetical protein